jgi:hypothetical protein
VQPGTALFQKELVMVPTNKNMVGKMKAIGVAFLAAAEVAPGSFDRYKLAESPMVLVTLPVNILGIFSMFAINKLANICLSVEQYLAEWCLQNRS